MSKIMTFGSGDYMNKKSPMANRLYGLAIGATAGAAASALAIRTGVLAYKGYKGMKAQKANKLNIKTAYEAIDKQLNDPNATVTKYINDIIQILKDNNGEKSDNYKKVLKWWIEQYKNYLNKKLKEQENKTDENKKNIILSMNQETFLNGMIEKLSEKLKANETQSNQ